VEDPKLRQSRRLLGLPLVTLEPPPPPLRRKLDQQGSFEVTRSQLIVPEHLLEESTTTIGSVETPNTDFLAPFVLPIYHERQTVPHTAMETNVVTSSGNTFIPTIIVTTGEPSPNLPSLSRATMVSAATMSHSGPNPSMAVTTTPFTSSATGPPFSYGMLSLGTSSAITYSTLQTLGLGAGISNAPLQGQLGGIPVPFNSFSYTGGHISPSSPSLGGLHQQSVGQPAHTSSFAARSQGTLVHTMTIGSSPFVWNETFGNNTFASTAFLFGGTPIFRQSTPVQGTIPMPGAHIAGPWNSEQGSVPSSGMSFWGNSFHSQWNPGHTSMPLQSGPAWGNPSQSPSNMMHAQHPMSFMGNQPMMSPQMENPYAGQGHGFYQNLGQQPNFSWQPGASQTLGPFFPGYQQEPKLPFLVTLHLPYLTRLLNDPIFHDSHWPPMPMKLPSDIPKFKAKPNEDLGDYVTTFHLWCSSNSLKDDSIHLRLFQRILIGSVTKWYIELDHSRYSSFGELAMAFLNHF
jgi:hypothetical protein